MRKRRTKARAGTTLTELVVAGVLFLSALGVVSTSALSVRRIWQDGEHYRFAVDELTNQLEVLTALDVEEVEEAVRMLEVSDAAAKRLPDAKIEANLSDSGKVTHIELNLTWRRIGEAEPVTLSGWIANAASVADEGGVE